MPRSFQPVLAAALCVATLLPAQSNSRGAGYDGALYEIGALNVWGRRGAAYPNGEIGVSFMNGVCNPGTMNLEWRAPMDADHPKFSFLVARLQDGRIVQISDRSYVKHGFVSLNDPGSHPSICGAGPCFNLSGSSLIDDGAYPPFRVHVQRDSLRVWPRESGSRGLFSWPPREEVRGGRAGLSGAGHSAPRRTSGDCGF